MIGRTALTAAVLLCLGHVAQADELDRLVAAYPDMIAGRSGNAIEFRSGKRLEGGRRDVDAPFIALLRAPSLRDQFLIPYRTGALAGPPPENDDPGRFRNKAFFDAVYGDCRKGEVERNLVPVVWLPRSWGHTIRFTSVNGAAERLKAVSGEIEALPEAIRRAAFPSAGTYSCRSVADNGQPSMHAYGAAIDLNLAFSDYWLWQKSPNGRVVWRNRMPQRIVDIFERHGFIWGGKWYHYDTMHFEYRPELLPLALASPLR